MVTDASAKCNCYCSTNPLYFIVYRREEAIHTANQSFDYGKADHVWRRVAPGENPYPELRTAGTPSIVSGALCRELLRQELRHTSELLTLLEKSLAESL